MVGIKFVSKFLFNGSTQSGIPDVALQNIDDHVILRVPRFREMFTDRLAGVVVRYVMSVSIQPFAKWLARFANVPAIVATVFAANEVDDVPRAARELSVCVMSDVRTP